MQRPRFRVFISSPGDVSEERRIVASAVDRLRRRFAGACELVEYRWENDVFLATDGGFQEQIARASEFDLCVFILWSRLGTPLSAAFNRPDGTPYQSGTEFEFDDAVEGSRRRGRPYVILFRKVRKCVLDLSDDADTVHERVSQYRRLESFISSRMKGPDGAFLHAFNEFGAADELESKVSQKLEQLILRLLAGEGDGATAAPSAPPAAARAKTDVSPFRGLRRFEPADADLYFGRRRATQEVLEQLRARAEGGSPFVLIFGGSGVGKSSFARAGLLPFLTDPGVIAETRAWRWSIFEPSDSTGDLIDGLAATLLTANALPRLAARLPEAELARALRGRESSLVALLRTELAAHGGLDAEQAPVNGTPFPIRYALLIDPVEEIFTRQGATAEDREAFLQTLEWLLGTGLFWVVGTMRSDFFERCAEHRRLLDLKHGNGQYHLAPPSHAELGQMIRLPAQSAGLEFEADPVRGPLDDFLLEEASRDPGALPLLEFTLDEVWKKSDAGRIGRLTFRAFDELGGVRGAISSRAREVLGQIRARLGARTDRALSGVFGMLVGTGERADHVVVRLYAQLARFDRDPDQRVVVDALIEARLFLTDIDDEDHPVVTLAHESLLRHWPELVEWVEANREFLMLRERIDRAARQWDKNGKHADYLLGEGRPLVEGRHLLDNNRDGMTPLQVEFVERSAQADRERQRSRVRGQRRFTALVASLAVVATVAFAVTWYQRRQAVRQRQTAVAQAKGSHELVQQLLNEVRENLSPTEKKDAALMAKLSERVTSHYEQLRHQDDSDEVRAQHAESLMGLCRSFAKIRDFDRAARLANEVVQIRTEVFGQDDPSIAEACWRPAAPATR